MTDLRMNEAGQPVAPSHTDRTTVRAAALHAATSWLPVTDGEDELYALAERFAAWIEEEQ